MKKQRWKESGVLARECFVVYTSKINMNSTLDLQSIKSLAQPVFMAHDVSYAGLFGSYSKGSAGPESDVDILVRFNEQKSLLDIISLEQDLEQVFDREVDVLTEGAVSPYLRDSIYASLRPIYG
ncbi:MAG TPA: nucleotidyltransferase family protein [Candidatus Paceibacterota bacterium]